MAARPASIDPALALVWLTGAGCAIGAAYQAKYHRLVALILLGGAGLVTCITFVWFSAPDLALTQLVVEVVTTILILLGLRWLPKRFEDMNLGPAPFTHAAASLAATLPSPSSSAPAWRRLPTPSWCVPLPDTIGSYFLERSYVEGGGRNVVNVILVDFRGFDTMGEITVLAVVALAVYALLRRFRPAPDSIGSPVQQRRQNAFDEAEPDRAPGDTVGDYLLVPAVIMQWLFPVIIVLALYLFMRGHDLPGRRLCRRSRPGDRLHPAIPGLRHDPGRGSAAHPAGATGSASVFCSPPRPAWRPGCSATRS